MLAFLPEKSTKPFSPALCTCRIVTLAVASHRRYTSQKRGVPKPCGMLPKVLEVQHLECHTWPAQLGMQVHRVGPRSIVARAHGAPVQAFL